MIKTKEDLKRYLAMDKFALCKNYKRPKFFSDEAWKFQICLRKYEYYLNTKSNKLLELYYKWKWHRWNVKLHCDVYPNVFGPGLRINHRGPVVTASEAKVGSWCDIQQGVTIGLWKGLAPKIGNRVWIGPGAKIFEDVNIPDDTFIGANAVVCKSVEQGAIAGIPAKLVNKSTLDFLRVRESEYTKIAENI